MFWEKKNPTYKCNRTKISAKYRIFVKFSFSQNLVPFIFAFNSYIPPTIPLENVFSLLVSSIFIFNDEIRASKRQKYQWCELLSTSTMNRIPTRYELQTPTFFQDQFCSCYEQTNAFFINIVPNEEDSNLSSRFWRYSSHRLAPFCCFKGNLTNTTMLGKSGGQNCNQMKLDHTPPPSPCDLSI